MEETMLEMRAGYPYLLSPVLCSGVTLCRPQETICRARHQTRVGQIQSNKHHTILPFLSRQIAIFLYLKLKAKRDDSGSKK